MSLGKGIHFKVYFAILLTGLFSCSLFAENEDHTAFGKLLKSVELSLGFNAGWAFMRFADFNESNEAFEEYFANIQDMTASTRKIGGSFVGTLYLLAEWNVFKTHKLGFSVGYKTIPGGTFEQRLTSQTFNMTNTYRIINSGIPIGFSYKVPMKVKGIPFRIKILTGMDIVRSVVKYDSLLHFSGIAGMRAARSLGYDYDEKLTEDGKLKGSGLGGYLASEVECDICDFVSFFFGCGCWCECIDDYEGPVNNYDGETGDKTFYFDDIGGIFAGPTDNDDYKRISGDNKSYRIWAGLNFAAGRNNHAYAEKKKKSRPNRKSTKRF